MPAVLVVSSVPPARPISALTVRAVSTWSEGGRTVAVTVFSSGPAVTRSVAEPVRTPRARPEALMVTRVVSELENWGA